MLVKVLAAACSKEQEISIHLKQSSTSDKSVDKMSSLMTDAELNFEMIDLPQTPQETF